MTSGLAERRLQALQAWRTQMLALDHEEHRLPSDADLQAISLVDQPTTSAIKALDLERPAAAVSYGAGIVKALRDVPAHAEPTPPATPTPSARPANAEEAWGTSVPAATTAGQQVPLHISGEPGAVHLSWDPLPGGGNALYRVVWADKRRPVTPEDGTPITTFETGADDVAPFTYAMRHYGVWARPEQKGGAAAPQLHAEGTFVAPPSEVTTKVESRVVYGQWELPEGVRAVEVRRIDARNVDDMPLSAGAQITVDGSLRHFTDAGAPAGSEVVYRLFSVVDGPDGDELLSAPTTCRARIPGELPRLGPIEHSRRDGGALDLRWPQSSPGARLHVARTDVPPAIGEVREVSADALETVFGAPLAEVEVPFPPQWNAGTGSLDGVDWRTDWPRVYFTAVAVDGDRAVLGPTLALARAGEVRGATLTQRVTWQQLTFDWPAGTDAVRVLQTGIGVPVEAGESLVAVTREGHAAGRPVRFEGYSALPKEGVDLHLVPVAYNAGAAVTGTPTSVRYPGLVRLRYQLTPRTEVRTSSKKLFAKPTSETVVVGTSLQVATNWAPEGSGLRLTLVANPRRLPLWPGDGAVVARTELATPGANWVVAFDLPAGLQGQTLRCFGELLGAGQVLAVLDPPLATLRQ